MKSGTGCRSGACFDKLSTNGFCQHCPRLLPFALSLSKPVVSLSNWVNGRAWNETSDKSA